ncbi:RCC1 domain-containing protein [Myxococcus sp. 1LA]
MTVADGRGGQTTGRLNVCVGPRATARFAPQLEETYQSSTTMPAIGGTVNFGVQAKDGQDRALAFNWVANAGTLGEAHGTATTSGVAWTAPRCGPEGTTPTIRVTVTNALGLSTSASVTLQGATDCGTDGWARVAAGSYHTVTLKHDGTVWSWGSNSNGQLGDGTTVRRMIPARVTGLDAVTAIATGDGHTVARRQDGTVWVWGHNSDGQLGDGTRVARATPARVMGLEGITAVAAGGAFTVALRRDGTVWAWGSNSDGQLGDGSVGYRTTPGMLPWESPTRR